MGAERAAEFLSEGQPVPGDSHWGVAAAAGQRSVRDPRGALASPLGFAHELDAGTRPRA